MRATFGWFLLVAAAAAAAAASAHDCIYIDCDQIKLQLKPRSFFCSCQHFGRDS